MKKIIIGAKERGLLYRNGCFVRVLTAGRYYTRSSEEVEVLPLTPAAILPQKVNAVELLADPAAAPFFKLLTVAEGERVLAYVDGVFRALFGPGRYLFWEGVFDLSFITTDASTPDVSPDVPRSLFDRIAPKEYTCVTVPAYTKARLFFGGRFERLLEPGTYYFWNLPSCPVMAQVVDVRLTTGELSGQEMLTADKVTIRVNMSYDYRVTDCVRVAETVSDYAGALRQTAQLALREFVCRHTLDELLNAREEMAAYVLVRMKAREEELAVEVTNAGVKDVILPGEIRDIMNTVLLAEKQAQANVITRREEVASTRSLLNTARLLDENVTLRRLKELEYVERICEKVGSINIAGADLLSALGKITGEKE